MLLLAAAGLIMATPSGGREIMVKNKRKAVAQQNIQACHHDTCVLTCSGAATAVQGCIIIADCAPEDLRRRRHPTRPLCQHPGGRLCGAKPRYAPNCARPGS